ncbi:MAG: hypothetical protein J0I20_32730 [Chloroflexi bacterium]|nr:hypothetical protein [Chloroflexota bacterium]OJV91759.1 MAG: hypothetical protein BGO39_17855 [Chloroflexi bacterium 54-19]
MSNELLKKAPQRAKVNSLLLIGLLVLLGISLSVALVFWLWAGAGTGSSQNQQLLTSSPAATPAGSLNKSGNSTLTQTSEGGQVTLKVTWQGLEAGPVFTVAMDTHSVNLDGYDLRQLAVLKTASGQEIKPVSWEAPAGGHHRQGTLRFPAALATADQPVFGAPTGSFQLVIKGVGDLPERVLAWSW